MRPLRALALLLLAVPAASPRPVHAAPAASGFCGVASQNLKVGSGGVSSFTMAPQ
jgi:hypothetical protein